MQLQGFFKKPRNELEKGGRTPVSAAAEIHTEPGEVCPACKKSVPSSELWDNHLVCSCGYHFRMNARQRIDFIADSGSFCEMDADLRARDVIHFLVTIKSSGMRGWLLGKRRLLSVGRPLLAERTAHCL